MSPARLTLSTLALASLCACDSFLNMRRETLLSGAPTHDCALVALQTGFGGDQISEKPAQPITPSDTAAPSESLVATKTILAARFEPARSSAGAPFDIFLTTNEQGTILEQLFMTSGSWEYDSASRAKISADMARAEEVITEQCSVSAISTASTRDPR